jgi:hypothetical protein
MIELTWQGAAILAGIAAFAWIAILWTEHKPPRPGE